VVVAVGMSVAVTVALGVRVRRVLIVLMSVFAMRVIVPGDLISAMRGVVITAFCVIVSRAVMPCVTFFAVLGGAVGNWGCRHDGSRENSATGSATCSSMPASMPLMCRSAAR
jgi:hypothetical protein